MLKPINNAQWATDENYSSGVDSGTATKVTPSAGVRGQGAVPDTGTAAQHMNELLNVHGEFVQQFRNIDWVNWSYPRVTEFSNDTLSGVFSALAYRSGLSFRSEADGDGEPWLGNKSTTPWGVVSSDGNKWETDAQGGASGGNVAHSKAVYWNSRLGLWFVGLDASATYEVLTSSDGSSWTANAVANDDDCGGILDNGTVTVICRSANGFILTANGTVFTEQTHPASNKSINDVAWDGSGVWCAVGNAGTVVTSDQSDASSWTDQTSGSGTTDNLESIAWESESGLFCAVGASNTIITSPDGETWTSRDDTDIAGDLNCIIADGNGTLFCTGNKTSGGGVLGRSQDGGITWEWQHQRVIDTLKGCVIGQGRLVLFGSAPENFGSSVIGVGLGLRNTLE